MTSNYPNQAIYRYLTKNTDSNKSRNCIQLCNKDERFVLHLKHLLSAIFILVVVKQRIYVATYTTKPIVQLDQHQLVLF